MVTLDAKAFTPLLSDYLAHGYREDDIALESVAFDPPRLEGWFRVRRAFLPSDGQFHLSATMALNCISQLGIMYALLDNRCTRKSGEIYATELVIFFNRPIRELEFPISVCLENKELRTRSIRYSYSFSVANGAFLAQGGLVCPRQAASVI